MYLNVVRKVINPAGISVSSWLLSVCLSAIPDLRRTLNKFCFIQQVVQERKFMSVLFPNDTHWALMPRDVP